jgi:DNA polymerase-3 subunit beta
MKCEVDRELFAECLQGVVNTIPARTTYPVLQNIMIEVKAGHLIMAATDLDTYVRRELPVAPETSAVSGKVILPGKKLLEVTSEMEEPLLVLSHTNNTVKLESGKNVYTFAGLDPAEYPEPPAMPSEFVVDFPLPALEAAYEATAFAAARDETRPAMTGVYWEIDPGEMRMVATDGHRLAFIRTPGDFKAKARVIITPKLFNLFSHGEDKVKIKADGSKIGLEFASTTIISRLIEGPYPDYDRVIPKSHSNTLKVNRDKLSAALRRASVFANPIARPVTFDLKDDGAQLLAETPELGQAQEVLNAIYTGEAVKTAFNATFVIEILRHIPTTDVVLEMSTSGNAGVLKPDGEQPDRLYLLMPIRMD